MSGYIYLLEVIEPESSFFGFRYIGLHCGSNPWYFSSGSVIKPVLKKYGKQAFKRTIIVNDITNINLLNELEIHYIRLYNTYRGTSKNGLNLTTGGKSTKGFKLSEDTKRKLSESHKGNKHSEEAKRKISETHKGRKHSKKQIRNRSISNSKPVLQYDKQMNFIREWESATAVRNVLGINKSHIGECCMNKLKYAGGYIWKYKLN